MANLSAHPKHSAASSHLGCVIALLEAATRSGSLGSEEWQLLDVEERGQVSSPSGAPCNHEMS